MSLDPLPLTVTQSYGAAGLGRLTLAREAEEHSRETEEHLRETEERTPDAASLESQCMRRFWPGDRDDSIGFFFARLRKHVGDGHLAGVP